MEILGFAFNMLFCPECGSIMKAISKDKKKSLACSCGYTSKDISQAKIKEHVINTSIKIEVVDKERETDPITDAECPQCQHKKAYYWFAQTRAGDEPETKFHKCVKCKHTWRDYS